MRFGMHLRELSRLPVAAAASALLAAFAAVWSVAHISLMPPRLEPRALDMATASTQIVVDTPYSAVLDLRQGTDQILPLKDRAVLLGTLMASAAVHDHIARRAGVPPQRLQIAAPRTPQQPRPVEQSGAKKGPGDLLKSTDQYRLDVQANPTMPLLTVDAQAPTVGAAKGLANAAVAGLRDYVQELAASEKTPPKLQVTLRQLGTAEGSIINRGVRPQVIIVVWLAVFALACAACIVFARVRSGWQVAEAEQA
jgi:hypothetical protein